MNEDVYPPRTVAFAAGALLVIFSVGFISECDSMNHRVGSEQKACMTIINDHTRKYESLRRR